MTTVSFNCLPCLICLQIRTHDTHRHNTFDVMPYVSMWHKRRTQNKGKLVFHFLFYLKYTKDMESRSISGVTSTCRNPCRSTIRHSKGVMAYLCSQNLLSYLLKYNTEFLKKYKRARIFGSAYSKTWLTCSVFVDLFVCLPVCLSVCLSVWLFLSLCTLFDKLEICTTTFSGSLLLTFEGELSKLLLLY